MLPEIRTTPLSYTIRGRSLQHDPQKPFGQEIIALLNQVWPILKSNNILSDGINRVVYDSADGACTVFAGILLPESAAAHPALSTLEQKHIHLTRYAYWKHTGPYHLIPKTGQAMTAALKSQGLQTTSPMIEVYGHWTNDESKLETETFVALA